MRRKSEKTKRKLGMGKGQGAKYKPYLQNGEFGSSGKAIKAIDWKTLRTVHLFSNVEYETWLLCMWDDGNLDIREQFPLDKKMTIAIAEELGYRHPQNKGEPVTMTTDLLLTRKDKDIAISVKYSKDELKNRPNDLKKLIIEKTYWNLKKIEFKLIDKEDIDHIKAMNIRDVTYHYNDNEYIDDISLAKYLIAHKYLEVNMSEELDYQKIIQMEDFRKWKLKVLK